MDCASQTLHGEDGVGALACPSLLNASLINWQSIEPRSEQHQGPEPDAHGQLIAGLYDRLTKSMMICAELGPLRRSSPGGHMKVPPDLLTR